MDYLPCFGGICPCEASDGSDCVFLGCTVKVSCCIKFFKISLDITNIFFIFVTNRNIESK